MTKIDKALYNSQLPINILQKGNIATIQNRSEYETFFS